MNKIYSLLLLGPMMVLASCASMMSGTSQKVSVQAIDSQNYAIIPQARCALIDAKGSVYPLAVNPGDVLVSREYGALQAHCSANHYKQKAIGVGENFNAWTVANVIFWPGAIVDGVTGAAMKYPSHITVLMDKDYGSSSSGRRQ